MNPQSTSATAALLPFLGVIRASGEDAAQFLQGQFTQDTRLLEDGRTQLSACCTPQGRVIALLRLKRTDAGIFMLVPADLLESLVQHLRRYVLRARVKVEHATELLCGNVVTGPAPEAALCFDYSPNRQVLAAGAEAWRAAGIDAARDDASGTRDAWTARDIAEGIPQVYAASSQSYTPQMLNLDLLDGISFGKGCYTGQEIVVRTQHLGRIKRRTLRYRCEGLPPAPGTGLMRAEQKLGEVLVSAPVADACEFLAVTSLEARGMPLRLEDGRMVAEMGLPYGLEGGDGG